MNVTVQVEARQEGPKLAPMRVGKPEFDVTSLLGRRDDNAVQCGRMLIEFIRYAVMLFRYGAVHGGVSGFDSLLRS